ncbi:UDP-N-acetylmuramate--L-alanine ligase [bacterium]|nr:UDP-N-acetylmuramate--L-alanine ligase [bacterium]
MYKKKAHIHFVGIGGIGMSGIAKILKFQGYKISGCDLDLSQKSVKELISIGCNIYQGNNTPECNNPNIDILVYSSAIKTSNPEIVAARKRGIPTISRALMLAELMRTKYSVAIAGSHGKTTTTSLISHILIEANMDPTVIIGGHLKNISTNARLGKGDFLIAEADESDRSFLQLQATLAVVTNIDLEHLETYTDLEDVKQTFRQFLRNLPFYGKAILCIDDPNIRSLMPLPYLKKIKYGIDYKEDIWAEHVQLNSDHSIFDLHTKKQGNLGTIRINMPGRHNVLNCIAAIALSLDLNIDFKIIAQAMISFKGIDRRFSYNGNFKGAEVFDDYGHHPKEIYHTLQVARKRAQKKLTVVFQPHRYTRTSKLWNDFVDTFASSNVDNLIITNIYPASEQAIPEITSQNLVKAILKKNPHLNVTYIPLESQFEEITKKLKSLVNKNDLILLLGAGKINHIAKKLI